jgi:hypothetical protein
MALWPRLARQKMRREDTPWYAVSKTSVEGERKMPTSWWPWWRTDGKTARALYSWPLFEGIFGVSTSRSRAVEVGGEAGKDFGDV